jgi:hypothetical protein
MSPSNETSCNGKADPFLPASLINLERVRVDAKERSEVGE